MHYLLNQLISFISFCVICCSSSSSSSSSEAIFKFNSIQQVNAQSTSAVTPSQWLGDYSAPTGSCTPSSTCCCASTSTQPMSITLSQSDSSKLSLTGLSDSGAGCKGQTSLSGEFTLNSDATEATYTVAIIQLTTTIKRSIINNKVRLTLTTTQTECPVILERDVNTTDGVGDSSTETGSTAAALWSSTAVMSGNDQSNSTSESTLPDGYSSTVNRLDDSQSIQIIFTTPSSTERKPTQVILHTQSNSEMNTVQSQSMSEQVNNSSSESESIFISDPIELKPSTSSIDDSLLYSFTYVLESGESHSTQQQSFDPSIEASTNESNSTDTSTSGSNNSSFILSPLSPLFGTFSSESSQCVPSPRCCCVVGQTTIEYPSSSVSSLNSNSSLNELIVTATFHGDVLSCYTLTNEQRLTFTATSDTVAIYQYNPSVQFTARYNASTREIQVDNTVHPKCPTILHRQLSSSRITSGAWSAKSQSDWNWQTWMRHALACFILVIFVW